MALGYVRRGFGWGWVLVGLGCSSGDGAPVVTSTVEAAGTGGVVAPTVTAMPMAALGAAGARASVAAADGGRGGRVVEAAGAGAPAQAPAQAGHAGSAVVAHAHDHCVDGYQPEPSDDTMVDGPAEFYPPGNMDPSIVDLTVQPQVLKWMTDNLWQAAHVEWHAIRACNLGGGRGLSKVDICKHTELIPEDQNCQTAGDGYQFLVFHRHMIHALKQLWPKHPEQFTGFTKFPTSAADVPAQWRSAWKDWDSNILEAGRSAMRSTSRRTSRVFLTRACSASGCSATWGSA